MAPFLAYAMQDRGTDSWGMTNGSEVVKDVGPILAGYYIPDNWDRGIFHTRAASVGAVTVENAHPFTVSSEERTVIGIHNGHISNYHSLNTNHSRECSVDSQHLFHHIHANMSMDDIYGWGAVAWYDTDDFDHLQLVKFNMDDLHIAKLKNGDVVFASTRSPIVKAAQAVRAEIDSFYQIESGRRYRLGREEGLLVGPVMPFGTRSYSTYTPSSSTSGSYGFGGRGSSWRDDAFHRASNRKFNPDNIDLHARTNGQCAKCKKAGVNRRSALVCETCFARFFQDLDRLDSVDTLYLVRGEWITAADFLGLTDEAIEADFSVGEIIQGLASDDDSEYFNEGDDSPPFTVDDEPSLAELMVGEVGVSGGRRFVS